MTKQLFIDHTNFITNTCIRLSSETSHHLNTVLRINVDDTLTIIRSSTDILLVKITDITETTLSFNIIRTTPVHSSSISIDLFQCLPKQDKLSDIIRRCTEINVRSIIPIHSMRSIPKLHKHNAQKKYHRWQRIAENAAEQAQLMHIPKILPSLTMEEIPQFCHNRYDLYLLPWEEEKTTSLRSVLRRHKSAKNIALVIGPEGGLDKSEVDFLVSKSFISCSLGQSILRTENAAFYAMAGILYELENN